MKVKYKTLSGKEGEVSEEFFFHGLSLLWQLYTKAINPLHKRILDEAQNIISAVLYGEIEKNDH